MSEKPKWTPGPWAWRYEEGPEWYLSPGILKVEGGMTDGTPQGDPIDIANAHLIAAAPGLYAALEALAVEMCDYMAINHLGDPEQKHNIKLARAALAKARGEA